MPGSKTLRVSSPAKRDLAGIGDYTHQRWGAAQKQKYLGLIKDSVAALWERPGIGAPRDDIATGLKSHPVGSHIIFYRETPTELVIVRVLHKSMDPARHLD